MVPCTERRVLVALVVVTRRGTVVLDVAAIDFDDDGGAVVVEADLGVCLGLDTALGVAFGTVLVSAFDVVFGTLSLVLLVAFVDDPRLDCLALLTRGRED